MARCVQKNTVRALGIRPAPQKGGKEKKRERERGRQLRAGGQGGWGRSFAPPPPPPQAGRIRLVPPKRFEHAGTLGAPSTEADCRVDRADGLRPQLAQINWLIDYWLIIDQILIDYWLVIDDISYDRLIVSVVTRQLFHATFFTQPWATFTHATSGKKMRKGDFILFSGAKFYEVNYPISELLRKMKQRQQILTTSVHRVYFAYWPQKTLWLMICC